MELFLCCWKNASNTFLTAWAPVMLFQPREVVAQKQSSAAQAKTVAAQIRLFQQMPFPSYIKCSSLHGVWSTHSILQCLPSHHNLFICQPKLALLCSFSDFFLIFLQDLIWNIGRWVSPAKERTVAARWIAASSKNVRFLLHFIVGLSHWEFGWDQKSKQKKFPPSGNDCSCCGKDAACCQ